MNHAQRIRIADGVWLTVIPCDSFKSNYLFMHFIAPLEKETAADGAMFPRILRCGCGAFPDITAVTRQTQMLYGATLGGFSAGKRGEMQIFTQSAWMLDNRVVPDGTDVFGGTMDLFEELWFRPLAEEDGFLSKYTETEKNILCDGLRARINNKNSYAVLRARQEMFAGERFGISESGELDTVQAVTPQSAYRMYQHVLRHSPCELIYIGHGKTDDVAARLSKMFCGVHRESWRMPKTEVIRRASSVREIHEQQPANQSKLSLGFRTGTCEADGSRPVTLMLNEIYGNSPLSKLFMNVREKRSLCYYCSSAPEQIKGVLFVNCGISADKKEEAQSEILQQLEDIRNGNITDTEMEAARKSLCSAMTQIQDEPESMAAWYFSRRLSGNEVTVEEEMEQIRSVTRQQIADAAQKLSLDTVYFMEGTFTDNSGEEEYDDDD
ncbi:MAG: insulinase family protein [Clostridia bacterium]|nr:insulinase family protein [Clostridia bacterium]